VNHFSGVFDGMHADQGTSVTTSSATAQRKEERREWKLYLYPWHSVYFGWQTRLALGSS